MLYLFGGFVILCGLLLLGYLFVNTEPARLAREEAIGPTVLPYLNRLSDALFVMARYENHERGVTEPLWEPGA